MNQDQASRTPATHRYPSYRTCPGTCETCQVRVPDRLRHYQKYHPDFGFIRDRTANKTYLKCERCGLRFSGWKEALRHAQAAHGVKFVPNTVVEPASAQLAPAPVVEARGGRRAHSGGCELCHAFVVDKFGHFVSTHPPFDFKAVNADGRAYLECKHCGLRTVAYMDAVKHLQYNHNIEVQRAAADPLGVCETFYNSLGQLIQETKSLRQEQIQLKEKVENSRKASFQATERLVQIQNLLSAPER